ncbi:MAG TPA: M24 family metallopeptidase [Thermoanaerobaculia bacterium]|nr:M24 family metallopeptidase [Thermoanaerobaculia bacterium]
MPSRQASRFFGAAILALSPSLVGAAPAPSAALWAPQPIPPGVTAQIRPLPSLREQAREQQAWLEARLTRVLPGLMRENGVDLWILSMREYAEDPVFFSIASPTTFAARRRSIYVFHDRGPEKGVERLALGGNSQGGLFTAYRDPSPQVKNQELMGDPQWRMLRQIVEDAHPKRIALDIDPVHAFADGLHAGEREALEAALGPEYVKRVVRTPELALHYIGTRVPEMMPRYREIEETVHALLTAAFSSAVITPGTTTNRLQDTVLAELKPGRTGNEVLAAARAAAQQAGIEGTVYSHPIGDHGHGAGPLIGLWDHQEGVPGRGDLKVRPATWYSIELQSTSAIPEWGGRKLSCRQEEEAYLDDQGERHWVYARQERFHLVR